MNGLSVSSVLGLSLIDYVGELGGAIRMFGYALGGVG